MLVVSRKIGEGILIGEDIVITIVKLTDNRVRVGIEAPRDVRVIRSEIENKLDGKEGEAA